MIDRNQLTQTQLAIVDECDRLALMLIEKNRQYGNSALEPIRVFSKAGPLAQLDVRMDDKLSRIVSGQLDDNEDSEMDLAGYLILKSVARKRAGAVDKDSLTTAPNSYLEKLHALRHGREGSVGYVVPPVQDGDDDPAVVHVVPDRSSRTTLPEACLGALCGRRQAV